ncbi:MAG: S9 family peptidase [Burkholderiaceae bacterium]|jgi:dipeptidyl aminopeptidase/acylaminoacyl peptidase
MSGSPKPQSPSWDSPISAQSVAQLATPLDQPQLDGSTVCWIEGRPKEGGRAAVMCAGPSRATYELSSAHLNVRSRVHEYGGGAYLVSDGILYASHFEDNRVYRCARGEAPQALTAAATERFADFAMDAARSRLIAVREDHGLAGKEPQNALVAIPLDGSASIRVLVDGSDFFSSPCLSPRGDSLAWLSWRHPQMPWDGCELWTAGIAPDGSLVDRKLRAGGPRESLFQPAWSPDGVLYVISDRSGWWNLYRVDGDDVVPICPMQADFGRAQWVLGMSTYGFESAHAIIATYTLEGESCLARIDLRSDHFEPLASAYSDIDTLRVGDGQILVLAGSPQKPSEIATIALADGLTRVLAKSVEVPVPAGSVSIAESFRFPSTGPRQVHAFYYAPLNPNFCLPEGERPPLVVVSHGGPTSRTTNAFRLAVQFWTSRGFAVLDVNYGGSSGFGRRYREALNGRWGIVDVDDCIAGARFLAERGRVDPQRLVIRGGSAGGFTTLCALTFHDTFKAGASYYGVSDLKALDRDTHKFESRYTDTLLAEEPERTRLYFERSPIHHVDRLACPVIFFQGLDDRVVPPSQSEMMVEALRERGIALAYLPLEGEGHGFRRAENIQKTLDAELYFYCRVLGLVSPDGDPPITVENLKLP